MPSSFVRAGMETYFSSPQTRKCRVLRQSGAHTNAERSLPTPASLKSIQPASRSQASTIPANADERSLRNDGRIWVPKMKGTGEIPTGYRKKNAIITSRGLYPSFGNLVPRDVASRRAKEMCDDGFWSRPYGPVCLSGFRDTIGAMAAIG